MITGELNIDKTIASVRIIEDRFYLNAQRAVQKTAATLMERIVARTVAPPAPPPVKYYRRKNRLVSGWGPAARAVGVSVPEVKEGAEGSNEGTVTQIANEKTILFRAENHVPYASAVELAGTWATPFPSRRPGYFIVLKSSQETAGEFEKNITEAWRAS